MSKKDPKTASQISKEKVALCKEAYESKAKAIVRETGHDIMQKRRPGHIADIRAVVIFSLHYVNGYKKIHIARAIGNHHTTVIYSIRKVDQLGPTGQLYPHAQRMYNNIQNYLDNTKKQRIFTLPTV